MLTDEWVHRAACRDSDPDLFYVENGLPADALRICRRCPVRKPCLDAALVVETPATVFGVRGGVIASRRAELLRARAGD